MATFCILLADLAMLAALVYFALGLRRFLTPHLHPDAQAPRLHRGHLLHRRHHRAFGHSRRSPYI